MVVVSENSCQKAIMEDDKNRTFEGEVVKLDPEDTIVVSVSVKDITNSGPQGTDYYKEERHIKFDGGSWKEKENSINDMPLVSPSIYPESKINLLSIE